MFFLPIGCLIFILFLFFLPLLFILGYFKIITLGFVNLGIPPERILLLFLIILIGSAVNIPLGKRSFRQVEEIKFFGLLRRPRIRAEGISINLGGAVIPVLLSLYFAYLLLRAGFDLTPVFVAILLMTAFSFVLARIVPGIGVTLPVFIPPILSAIVALILAPDYAAPCAFISGTLGVLLGADILNLPRIRKHEGLLSIGGAGVFDGIFLVGIVSALLSGF